MKSRETQRRLRKRKEREVGIRDREKVVFLE